MFIFVAFSLCIGKPASGYVSQPYLEDGDDPQSVPSILSIEQGNILISVVVSREKSTQISKKNSIVVKQSQGPTINWREVQTFTNSRKHFEFSSASLISGTNSDEILCIVSGYSKSKKDKKDKDYKLFITRSFNKGTSWEQLKEITINSNDEHCTNCIHSNKLNIGFLVYQGAVVKTSTGRILAAGIVKVVGKGLWNSVIYSDDSGKTWNFGKLIGQHASRKIKLLKRADNELILIITKNKNNQKFISYDNGIEWKKYEIEGEFRSSKAIFLSSSDELNTTNVFAPDEYGSKYYMSPAIATANDETLVAIIDARWQSSEEIPNNISIMAKTSTDKGKTWSEPKMLTNISDPKGFSNAAIVKDRKTGTLFVLFNGQQSVNNSSPDEPIRLYYAKSTDNGATWSASVEITDQIYGTKCRRCTEDRQKWYGMLISSGAATQLRDGRLMVSVVVYAFEDKEIAENYVMYSDDFGSSWNVGKKSASMYGTVAKIVENNDGDIILSISNSPERAFVVSKDRGETWLNETLKADIVDPGCNGDFIRFTSEIDGFNKNRLIHTIPYDAKLRKNLSVLMSYDEGESWPIKKVIDSDYSSYSSITFDSKGQFYILYEKNVDFNKDNKLFDIPIQEFTLEWLTDGTDKYEKPTQINWCICNSKEECEKSCPSGMFHLSNKVFDQYIETYAEYPPTMKYTFVSSVRDFSIDLSHNGLENGNFHNLQSKIVNIALKGEPVDQQRSFEFENSYVKSNLKQLGKIHLNLKSSNIRIDEANLTKIEVGKTKIRFTLIDGTTQILSADTSADSIIEINNYRIKGKPLEVYNGIPDVAGEEKIGIKIKIVASVKNSYIHFIDIWSEEAADLIYISTSNENKDTYVQLDEENKHFNVEGAAPIYIITPLPNGDVIFAKDELGCKYYMSPVIVTAKDGTLLAFTEARWTQSGGLPANISILMKQSTDYENWTDAQVITSIANAKGFSNPSVVMDQKTGTLLLFVNSETNINQSTPENPVKLLLYNSTDNGSTWSESIDITKLIYGSQCEDPTRKKWNGLVFVSGRAAQTREGRILLSTIVRPTSATDKLETWVVFSDNLGQTWSVGKSSVTGTNGNQGKLVQMNNGTLILSVEQKGNRKFIYSNDNGETWTDPTEMVDIYDPGTNGDIIKYTSAIDGYDKDRLILSLPFNKDENKNLSVVMSYDEGKTWPIKKVIDTGYARSSSLTVDKNGNMRIIYEKNDDYQKDPILFNEQQLNFSLKWLSDGDDSFVPSPGIKWCICSKDCTKTCPVKFSYVTPKVFSRYVDSYYEYPPSVNYTFVELVEEFNIDLSGRKLKNGTYVNKNKDTSNATFKGKSNDGKIILMENLDLTANLEQFNGINFTMLNGVVRIQDKDLIRVEIGKVQIRLTKNDKTIQIVDIATSSRIEIFNTMTADALEIKNGINGVSGQNRCTLNTKIIAAKPNTIMYIQGKWSESESKMITISTPEEFKTTRVETDEKNTNFKIEGVPPQFVVAPYPEEITLFENGADGYKYYMSPSIITTKNGSLIAFTDARAESPQGLPGNITIVMRRSIDNGESWTKSELIANYTDSGFSDPSAVLDIRTGVICLFINAEHSLNNSTPQSPTKLLLYKSYDEGVTWEFEKDFTNEIYGSKCTDETRKNWAGVMMSSGRATQIRDGRILVGVVVKREANLDNEAWTIYTDDLGETWSVSKTNAGKGGESKFVERNDTVIISSIRNKGNRVFAYSKDKGQTWENIGKTDILDPGSNGDFIRVTSLIDGYNKSRIIQTIPYDSEISRNMTVLMSYDEGRTWPIKKIISTRYSRYSSITIDKKGKFFMLYEKNVDYTHDEYLYNQQLAKFSLNWLTDDTDDFEQPKLIQWCVCTSPECNKSCPEGYYYVTPSGFNQYIESYTEYPETMKYLIFEDVKDFSIDLSIQGMTTLSITNVGTNFINTTILDTNGMKRTLDYEGVSLYTDIAHIRQSRLTLKTSNFIVSGDIIKIEIGRTQVQVTQKTGDRTITTLVRVEETEIEVLNKQQIFAFEVVNGIPGVYGQEYAAVVTKISADVEMSEIHIKGKWTFEQGALITISSLGNNTGTKLELDEPDQGKFKIEGEEPKILAPPMPSATKKPVTNTVLGFMTGLVFATLIVLVVIFIYLPVKSDPQAETSTLEVSLTTPNDF